MIQFPQEIARLTSPHANEQLATAFEELAAKYILNLRNQGFVKDVIAEIDKQLVQGSICIGSVADGLGLSTRSLKRTLEAENTTFSDILDEFRRNKAENLLSTSVYSITDIGYLCGYNESSSFVRAFRRWNGMSPRQYRGQAQQ
jgi:AraC-like DNA-binding protein